MGWFASGLGGAGAGAVTGATIGSFVPGIGTAIGAGVGALAGGLLGGASGAEASSIDKNQKFKDMPWYDRVATTMASKTEGLTKNVAGFFGLEDSVGSENQDLLSRLQHERSDESGTSFQMGSNITGGSGGSSGTAMNAPGTALSNQGTSLGRALAMEEEPALDQTNYNNNNFSF